MAISGALDNRLLDLADEIYEEGYADGLSSGLIEGARQALDAQALASALDELGNPADLSGLSLDENEETCACGCGLTVAELNAMDAAFEAAADEAEGCGCDSCISVETVELDPEDYVLLTKGEYDGIIDRLDTLEYHAGVKYIG